MDITGTLGLGLRHLLVAAALVGAACVGYVAVTDAGGETPSSYGTMPVAKATYSGPSMSRSVSSGMSSVAPSLRSSSMPHHSAAGAGGSYSIVSHMSSAAGGGQSVMTVDMRVAPSGGFIGNGGGGSASNGFQSTSVPILAVAAPRSVSAGAVLAPRRANVLHGTLAGETVGDITIGDLTVYDGDTPGVITGQENSTLDNTVIDNLTEPIGDALWPLLLFAIGFACYKRKNVLKNMKPMLHSLLGKRSNACLLTLCTLLLSAPQAWAVVDYQDYDGDGSLETYNVVYINLSGGNNSNDGSSKANAVKTWSQAYSLLPAYTGTTDTDRDAAWDSNIIVVCDASNNQLNTLTVTNKVPATITGVWPWTPANTTAANVKKGGAAYVNTGNDTSGPSLGMDTKFKYLRFRSVKEGSEIGSSYLQCYLHDVTFDVGCVMDDIAVELSVDNGLTKGNKAPDMHVMMYANTHNFDDTKADGGWPAQTKPMVLTIKSGKIGRLLSCRITGTSSTDGSIKKRYVVGNPSHPLMAIVNVDIDPETSEGAWNTKNYTNDIEFCCAGATQGMEYCDIKFNIKRGKIGSLVSACQGMSITQTKNLGLSNSSFFGRTEVTLIPNSSDDDITIYRYYGACLGRSQSSPSSTTNGIANTAFYGRSTLNMYGGRILNGVFISAGGVSGLQSVDGSQHTCDQYIPYLDNSDTYENYPYMGIKYQPYDAGKTIAKVTTIMNGTPEIIDLAETVTTLNIHGGEITGGVYGGSYGYSDVLKIQCAMEQAGSIWGNTHVNIYGGTIHDGVYGGGQGSPDFYNLAASANKSKFTTVASVYGDTYVNIYGGIIDGGIYGGGKGVEYQAAGSGSVTSFDTPTAVTLVKNEFLDIAKVYGNTYVTINPTDPEWTYTGDIYGGGALGAVEGNTNVTILGGIINGDVFGGGEGEVGHSEKAKVTGSTNVMIGEEL